MVSQFLGDLDLLICDENVKSNLSSPKPFLHAYYLSVSSWTACFKVFGTWKKHFEGLLRQDFEEGWLVLIMKISSLQGILVWSFGLLCALRKPGLSFKLVDSLHVCMSSLWLDSDNCCPAAFIGERNGWCDVICGTNIS